MEDAELWINKGVDFILEFGPKVIGAILIYIIGSWIIKKLMKLLRGTMSKQDYDKSLQKFLLSLAKWGLTIFLIITVISTLGVETTSLAAVIAAAGLAIGLALQGSLSNFAGGVLIIIFKPYKIDDLVEAQG
ncbi:MAG: mechanosensitive ion channel domain-containing protein, partial [Maribacter sp.]